MSAPEHTKLRTLRLNSPDVQNFVAGLVLALAPGMFTALASLGAGGSQASNTKVSSTVSAVLYAIYTFTGWFASLMLNMVGPRWTMALGAIGYPVYGAAFWYFDRTGGSWFPYLSAVVLGVSAGWLWSSSGYTITAYSTESTRGKFIAVQGVLSAMGSVVGAALTLGIVARMPDTSTGTSVPTAVYACFTTLMILSPFVAAFLLVDPNKIRRADGEKVAEFRSTKTTTVKAEFIQAISMVKDWKLMFMLPVFFASDVATVSPSMNAYAFDLKARTLLAFVTTLAAIPTVLCLWPLLDNPRWPRKVRGLCAITFLGLLVVGAWGGLLGWMKGKPVNDRFVSGPGYSWSDPAFGGFCVVYFLCGAVSGIYGSVILWLLSAFTNSPAKLANSVGLMKGTIAAGICIIFAIDSTLLQWSTEIAYAFTLQLLGVVIMFFLCATQVTETNYFKEDDVVVPVTVMENAPEDEVAKENQIHHQLEPTASDEKISA